jgi:hypothetical protein
LDQAVHMEPVFVRTLKGGTAVKSVTGVKCIAPFLYSFLLTTYSQGNHSGESKAGVVDESLNWPPARRTACERQK